MRLHMQDLISVVEGGATQIQDTSDAPSLSSHCFVERCCMSRRRSRFFQCVQLAATKLLLQSTNDRTAFSPPVNLTNRLRENTQIMQVNTKPSLEPNNTMTSRDIALERYRLLLTTRWRPLLLAMIHVASEGVTALVRDDRQRFEPLLVCAFDTDDVLTITMMEFERVFRCVDFAEICWSCDVITINGISELEAVNVIT